MKDGKQSFESDCLGIKNYRPRVLIMAHSHPMITNGGAEISAYHLYNGLRNIHKDRAWFLGVSNAASTRRLGVSVTQPFGESNYIYSPSGAFDHFKFANRDAEFPLALRKLVIELRPDIVHAHHYTQFGVEAFRIIKDAQPDTKVVLTLHEFLAICHNYGQMVKTGSFNLCKRETLTDCSKCFPALAPRDFFLRKRYISQFLNDVDLFVAPSQFLADRYITWGLPAAKMRVIENMPPPRLAGGAAIAPVDHADRRQSNNGARELRLGFFGQISPLKGIPVLMESARQLKHLGVTDLVIEIFGDYTNQPPEFQKSVMAALSDAGDNVRYHGPYENSQVNVLMRSVDAVLVPSIWWENSPVVIQEAYANRRPVICSNIGGMAEKVRPGLDGFHFEVGNAASLTAVLRSIVERPAVVDNLQASLREPNSNDSIIGAHLEAYSELRRPPASVGKVMLAALPGERSVLRLAKS